MCARKEERSINNTRVQLPKIEKKNSKAVVVTRVDILADEVPVHFGNAVAQLAIAESEIHDGSFGRGRGHQLQQNLEFRISLESSAAPISRRHRAQAVSGDFRVDETNVCLWKMANKRQLDEFVCAITQRM